MLFTVAPPVCVAKYSTKNLSDEGGGGEGGNFPHIGQIRFSNGSDKNVVDSGATSLCGQILN